MAFYHMQMQQENIDIGQYQVTVSDRLNNRPHRKRTRQNLLHREHPTVPLKKWQQIPPDALLSLNLRLHLWNTVWNRLNNSPTQNILFRSKQKDLEPKEIAGSQVLADTLSRQPTTLNVMESGENFPEN